MAVALESDQGHCAGYAFDFRESFSNDLSQVFGLLHSNDSDKVVISRDGVNLSYPVDLQQFFGNSGDPISFGIHHY